VSTSALQLATGRGARVAGRTGAGLAEGRRKGECKRASSCVGGGQLLSSSSSSLVQSTSENQRRIAKNRLHGPSLFVLARHELLCTVSAAPSYAYPARLAAGKVDLQRAHTGRQLHYGAI